MEPNTEELTMKVKDEDNDKSESSGPAQLNGIKREPNEINNNATVINAPEDANQNPIDVNSSEGEVDQSSEQDDQSPENGNKQLVLYDPPAAGGEIVPVPDPIESQTPPVSRPSSRNHSRVLPSVGAFTIQCANCFKWRLIPTKEKYEEIREHILEDPFYCETAREWRPEISCDDPTDISQDGSRLWAIDKPNIAQPPPGWQRLLRIRGEGGTKFADVYYQAPSGKRLRSMVEVEKYLHDNPQYMEEGVKLSQFSFQIPRPLQENYVRKRPARPALPHSGSGSGAPLSAEPSDANPIAWASADDDTDLHLGAPGLSSSYADATLAERSNEPKRRKTSSKRRCNDTAVLNQKNVEVGESSHL